MNVRRLSWKWLSLPVLVALLAGVWWSPASAAPPTLCLSSPVGYELYVAGQTLWIEWMSKDFDQLNPEHGSIDWVTLYYQWMPSGPLQPIVSRTDYAYGQYAWTVVPPPAGEDVAYLRVIVRYEFDGGGYAAEDKSASVQIVSSDSVPALGLTNPKPLADPQQTLPPTCFDHMTLEAGDMVQIRWKITGCDSVPNPDELLVQYTTEAGLMNPPYTTITTIDNPPCPFGFYNWTVPAVDTTHAKVRLVWRFHTITGTTQIATATSRFPFEITAGEANRAPTADAGSDQTVTGRTRTYLRGNGSSDPEGDPLTYNWTIVAGPAMYTRNIDLEPDDPSLPSRNFYAPSVTYETTITFQLTVSDPTHSPVVDRVEVTIRPDPNDPDGDWQSSTIDNCPDMANPDQHDQDGDGVGDACDNCWNVTNADQRDSDGDRRGDACDPCPYDSDNDADGDGLCAGSDNCPNYANAGQEDWDGDGEGDVCDCNDGFWAHNEIGMDCGAGCGTPCTTDICQPVIYQGPSEDKIDVLIIPADDYFDGFHDPEFLNPLYFATRDALDDLMRSYFADPIMGSAENRTKFNVWLDTGSWGDVDLDYGCDSPPCCDWHVERYRGNMICFGDVNYIIHLDSCRDYSSGAYFSATQGRFGILLHETGHGLFDLGDEYDDMGSNCSTYYGTAEYWSKSNIWRTRGYCEDYTSLDPDQCYRFTQCQGDWYKAQRGPNMMECFCDPDGDGNDDYPWAICEWGPDGQRMVDHVLGQYPGSSIAGASLSAADTGSSEPTKMMLGEFRYAGGRVTLADILVGYGTPPEPRLKNKGFQVVLRDAGGVTLSKFAVRDPRYKEYPADPPGGEWLKEVDFSVAMPFFETAKTLELVDTATSKSLGKFDVGPYVGRFCAEFSEDESCRCDGDLDQDRDVDGDDLYAFSLAYAKGKPPADLNEDLSVDQGDVAIFGRKYGRTDCPDPQPPNCDDGNLCTHDFFDPITRTCVHRSKRCYDGSQCTTDRCNPQTGNCEYLLKNCDDATPCTVDSCDPLTGACLHDPKVCNDGNACTIDGCDPKTGQCIFKSRTCNDGNLCTMDLCDSVTGCFYVPKPCDDQNPCTIDTCDPGTGQCGHTWDKTCQACCSPLGQCAVLPEKLCVQQGGTPQGAGTTCLNVTCKVK